MSEAVKGAGAGRARSEIADVGLVRSARELVRVSRFEGTARLLDVLGEHASLTPDEYRVYFMSWQAAHVLAPDVRDAAGWPPRDRAARARGADSRQ